MCCFFFKKLLRLYNQRQTDKSKVCVGALQTLLFPTCQASQWNWFQSPCTHFPRLNPALMLLSIPSCSKLVCCNTMLRYLSADLLHEKFGKLPRLLHSRTPSWIQSQKGRSSSVRLCYKWNFYSGLISTWPCIICSHFCNWTATLKWLSSVPCCGGSVPSDLQRMSNVIAWPSSSGGMLMELFGSLPPEAGGMDLFHLMSVWGSGGEKRITGWHRFNWQEGSKRKDTMQCFNHSTESRALIILGIVSVQFYFFFPRSFKVTPPCRICLLYSPWRRRHKQLKFDVSPSVKGEI